MLSLAIARRLIGLPRFQKTLIVVATDALIAAWAGWAAIYLRLGQSHWLYGHQLVAVLLPVVLAPPVFYAAGFYRAIFRHAAATDLALLGRGCFAFGGIYAAIYTFIGVDGVPRTIGLIQPLLMCVTLTAARVMAFHLLRPKAAARDTVSSALIYGAGETGRQLAAALRYDPSVRAVGFLDDDPSLHQRSVQGLCIYPPSMAERLIEDLGVTKIFIAVPSASRYRRRQIVETMGNVGVELQMLPSLADVAKGQFSVSDIRHVQIEDLLGREPVDPDPVLLHRDVADRVVMVTGGGGSIGSELSRQLLAARPRRLILVEASEYALYAIERELLLLRERLDLGSVDIVPLLGLVQDECQMRAIFETYRPETVYHAAAYKHVPLVETNPLRGIENNSLGTFVTASLACSFGARSFVLISTDKAVRPTNVMGATKRLAELAVQALASRGGATRLSCVRFGNVLGSSGSVVPLFREQIEKGGPVTVTHEDVTRYFMTIPEAAQLVIQSGAMATGGDIFLLDMGEPVRVMDLAVNMIHLSGLTVRNDRNPEGDIEIRTVGLRPGEKLYEELLIEAGAEATAHPRIMRAREPGLSFAEMRAHVEGIRRFLAVNDGAAGLRLLQQLVPGFHRATSADPLGEQAAE